MLQNQRACQLVRSQTGCEPLALAVAWGARTAGRCAAGVLGAVKHQRFSDQQLETFAARAPGICPKPVCDAGEPCPLPPQDDAVDVSVIVPVHNGERFLRACLDSILHQNTTRRLQVLAVEDGSTDGSGAILAEYARQGGVTVLHPEQGGTALQVADTGIGIPEKYRERIFERFFRVDKSRSKETGGTGLGLAIVKHIAQVHDATMELDSVEGKGTTITVHFPE